MPLSHCYLFKTHTSKLYYKWCWKGSLCVFTSTQKHTYVSLCFSQFYFLKPRNSAGELHPRRNASPMPQFTPTFTPKRTDDKHAETDPSLPPTHQVHLYLQGVALCCRACDQAAVGADKQVLRNDAPHHGNRSYTEASWDLNNNSICYCRSRAAAHSPANGA